MLSCSIVGTSSPGGMHGLTWRHRLVRSKILLVGWLVVSFAIAITITIICYGRPTRIHMVHQNETNMSRVPT